jgi:hypothetical protein
VDSKIRIFVFGGILVIWLSSGAHNMGSASSWSWTPSLSFSERYDDNVFLVRNSRTSDFVSIVEPQLRISSSTGQLSTHIQYRAQVKRYVKTSELNTVDHFADLEWGAHLSKSSSLTILDQFSFTSDSTQISSLGVAVPRGDVYSNNSAIRLQLSRVDLLHQHGLQGFEAAGFNDSESHAFHEQMALPLSARYEFTQSYGLRYFLVEGAPDLRSHTAGVGLRYHFSPTFFIGLEGGVSHWRTSSDESFRTEPSVRLNLQKSFRQLRLSFSYLEDIQTQFQGSAEYELRRTVLRMNYSKELTPGGGVFGTATDRQSASVNLQQDISRKADLALTVSYSAIRPIDTDLSRITSYRGDAAFGYVIQPWLRAGVYYNYFKQDSDDFIQQEFRRHQGTLSLTITMP